MDVATRRVHSNRYPRLRYQPRVLNVTFEVLVCCGIAVFCCASLLCFSSVKTLRGTVTCVVDGGQERWEQFKDAICEATRGVDPRFEALEILERVFQSERRHPLGETVMKEIRLSMEMGLGRKGTTVVLYCMDKQDICNQILRQVQDSLADELKNNACTLKMKANGKDHDDLAGETQNGVVKTVMHCRNAVIGFEDVDQISEGEMKSLIKAMSEGGSLMRNGKSFYSNEALYLLSMQGKLSNKDLGEKDLRFEAKQEFYNKSLSEKPVNESTAGLAAAFRRRIDHVYPIITEPCKNGVPEGMTC